MDSITMKINENEILQVLYLIYLSEFEWDDETELISLEVNQKNNTYCRASK